MIHGKTKRVLIAVLAVMMLVISSAFIASAASYNGAPKKFNVANGGDTGYFNATLNSVANNSTFNVTSCTFSTANATGVTTQSTKAFSGKNAYGKLVSCQLYGNYVTVTNSPAIIVRQTWSATGSCTQYTFSAGPNICPAS